MGKVKSSPTKRAAWDDERDGFALQFLIKCAQKGRKSDSGFKKEGFNELAIAYTKFKIIVFRFGSLIYCSTRNWLFEELETTFSPERRNGSWTSRLLVLRATVKRNVATCSSTVMNRVGVNPPLSCNSVQRNRNTSGFNGITRIQWFLDIRVARQTTCMHWSWSWTKKERKGANNSTNLKYNSYRNVGNKSIMSVFAV